MIALIIVLSVLAIIFLALILPLTVELEFEKELCIRINYAGFNVFDNQKIYMIKKRKRLKRKTKSANNQESSKEDETFFKKLCEDKGFLGAFKYCAKLVGILVKKMLWIIKRFKFRKFSLDLIVATDNAAKTAVEYGSICTAVYPTLVFLQTNLNFKPKSVNISTDFDKINPEFKISLNVTARLIYMLAAAISGLTQYLKLTRKESKNNERK